MRGLKSDLARALYLAKKADAGKEGERVKSFHFPHLLFFPPFYFPAWILEARVASCLLLSVGHGTLVKPNPWSTNIQKISACICFSCNKAECKAFNWSMWAISASLFDCYGLDKMGIVFDGLLNYFYLENFLPSWIYTNRTVNRCKVESWKDAAKIFKNTQEKRSCRMHKVMQYSNSLNKFGIWI